MMALSSRFYGSSFQNRQPRKKAETMRWLFLSLALLFGVGPLISTAVRLRSTGDYDEHMPDLEDIIGSEGPL